MLITSGRIENPDDILLWPDDFWCFRKEYYRVILHHSDEWLRYTRESRTPRAKSDGTGGKLGHYQQIVTSCQCPLLAVSGYSPRVTIAGRTRLLYPW